MSRADIYGFIGNRYVLAPGAIAQIGPISGINSMSIKLLAGGTLEIGGLSLSLGAVGVAGIGFTTLVGSATNLTAAGATFGVCYAMSSNEVVSGNASGKVFLYASGATCTVTVLMGQSQGY